MPWYFAVLKVVLMPGSSSRTEHRRRKSRRTIEPVRSRWLTTANSQRWVRRHPTSTTLIAVVLGTIMATYVAVSIGDMAAQPARQVVE